MRSLFIARCWNTVERRKEGRAKGNEYKRHKETEKIMIQSRGKGGKATLSMPFASTEKQERRKIMSEE